ncbi:MAG: hypothetical protein HS126_10480 [Anaerolineales bacterium]|nr:hypothetical protein [Anaerolineales bacterium]
MSYVTFSVMEIENMAMSLIVMVGCLLAAVMLAALIVGVIVILNSGERDVVSMAREGWINRRSDKDHERE